MFNKNVLFILACAGAQQLFAQSDSVKTQALEAATLTGIRANTFTPVTQFNLNAKQIKSVYYGADLPTVLQVSPSIHAYSDNGTGIGYSFFRLRGIDQSRINLTVNGVPLNDPENQGTFFNNFADLASSAQAIQIQRGVGTSTNGVASFGGSINILTQPIADKASAEMNLGLGSFGSRRLTAEVHTGKFNDKWGAYLRLSNLSTDGYRIHSGSEITSYLFSLGRSGEKSIFRLNMWGGDAQSQLAYNGIDESTLKTNRRFNPFVNGERDRFRQNFFQAQYQLQLNKQNGIHASAYYVRGEAPQFQYYFPASFFMPYSYFNMPNAVVGNDTLTTTDAMTAYRLDQHFLGAFVHYFYYTSKLKLDAGLHANTFSSDHFLETQWMRNLPDGYSLPQRAYFNTGYKQEYSGFIKLNYFVTPALNLYADLQLRNAQFQYEAQQQPFSATAFNVEDMSWTFFNPKLGLNYQINSRYALYAMVGRTGREPTRFDYFQDDFAARDIKQNDIKPEYVTDIEVGFKVQTQKLFLQANVYAMSFENAIVNTGRTNNFGSPITTNVSEALRSGIELDLRWQATNYLSFTHTSVFSYNRINKITQYYNHFTDTGVLNVGIDFNNVNPALTPAVILNNWVKLQPLKWCYVEAGLRYVSEQFVDNSNLKMAQVKSFTVVDARMGASLKKWLKQDVNVLFNINNVLNTEFVNWGNAGFFSNVANFENGNFTPSVTPLFFVAPPRNYFLTIQMKW